MRRLVLAFDTATEVVTVCLAAVKGDSAEVIATDTIVAPRAAMRLLLPSVENLLAAAGVSRRQIEAVVVGRGPGSFTGVRIGVATAKGLAHGLGVPLHGVGTLDAIAWAFAHEAGVLGVVGDAMRGEVYPALFRTGAGRVERLSEDTVAHPQTAAAAWAALGERITLAGNGLGKHRDVFAGDLGELADVSAEDRWVPTGPGLIDAWVAAGGPARMAEGDPGTLLPIYTRLSDAEENEAARRLPTSGNGVAGPEASR